MRRCVSQEYHRLNIGPATSRSPSPRWRGEGKGEGRTPTETGRSLPIHLHVKKNIPAFWRTCAAPLIPLPGPSPRLRGEGSVTPPRFCGATPAEHFPATSRSPSPRWRGEGKGEGRAPTETGRSLPIHLHVKKNIPAIWRTGAAPLIPLPGPSPCLRGEGSAAPPRFCGALPAEN